MDASTHAMHALASSWLLATKHDHTLGRFLGIFRRGRMGEMVGQSRAWDSGRCKRRLFGFCKTLRRDTRRASSAAAHPFPSRLNYIPR